jgi:DNA-binding response OmpR family regulator
VRILVVAADADMRALLADLLAVEGHSVVVAADGLAALDVAATPPPELILLDLDLLQPGSDGPTFVREYRAQPGSHAPIIVMSAARDVHEAAATLGAAGHLRKPFDVGTLSALLAHYTDQ